MAVFLDTNVLLYSLGASADETRKTDIARDLLDRRDVVLSVQILQEFYVQATRQSRLNAISPALARQFVQKWRRFQIIELDADLVEAAISVQMAHRFSYWDSAVIAAAGIAGCHTLFTEDLSHGRTVDSLRIVNPFL